ncbi:MAG: 8-oxoguanine DNA glycosylase [Armatimonadetes bacterium]|nr:8-oxoguanine DNA glycosylase [Akkermansiaceae bacterium]
MANYSALAGSHSCHKLGRSLVEEIAACLLGGYGMPAELGIAAFNRLRELGVLSQEASEASILRHLLEPIKVGHRMLRYRYPAQKAKFLALALSRMQRQAPPSEVAGKDLRDWLLSFEGIGPKTASWIARNYLATDEVAILDIHICRAGYKMGIFDLKQNVDRHYFQMEERFVKLAETMNVRTSLLDALIWEQMRTLPAKYLQSRIAA